MYSFQNAANEMKAWLPNDFLLSSLVTGDYRFSDESHRFLCEAKHLTPPATVAGAGYQTLVPTQPCPHNGCRCDRYGNPYLQAMADHESTSAMARACYPQDPERAHLHAMAVFETE
jgi:hypothetical protein